jgi:hypothetical protein
MIKCKIGDMIFCKIGFEIVVFPPLLSSKSIHVAMKHNDIILAKYPLGQTG